MTHFRIRLLIHWELEVDGIVPAKLMTGGLRRLSRSPTDVEENIEIKLERVP